MKKDQLETMSCAFQQICAGERPWTALGNFMNYWYAYAKDRREVLVIDPLPAYDQQSKDQQQWAAFCAASVEWFCKTYTVPCPSWVQSQAYILPEPWFFYPGERSRIRLLQTTPEEFKKRNIFCGNRCFLNKWELVEQLRQHSA